MAKFKVGDRVKILHYRSIRPSVKTIGEGIIDHVIELKDNEPDDYQQYIVRMEGTGCNMIFCELELKDASADSEGVNEYEGV